MYKAKKSKAFFNSLANRNLMEVHRKRKIQKEFELGNPERKHSKEFVVNHHFMATNYPVKNVDGEYKAFKPYKMQ